MLQIIIVALLSWIWPECSVDINIVQLLQRFHRSLKRVTDALLTCEGPHPWNHPMTLMQSYERFHFAGLTFTRVHKKRKLLIQTLIFFHILPKSSIFTVWWTLFISTKIWFYYIKRVDKGWTTTVKDLESWRFER